MSNENWYYRVELQPGKFTDGQLFDNLALTRRLLRNVDVRDRTAIDIGTQEGVIPVLLKKSGAGAVTAYDRFNKSSSIDKVKDAYRVDFDYINNIQLQELPGALKNKQDQLFDLIVFSGVLYHMINPLGHLALVRGLCKNNGLILIETMAIRSEKTVLHFNAKAALGGKYSNYFIPTIGWLDYVFHMLMLEPVQVARSSYFTSSHELCRIAILCQSKDTICPIDIPDDWMSQPFHKRIFSDESLVDWEAIKMNRSDIFFENTGEGFQAVQGDPLCEIADACSPYIADDREKMLRLDSEM